MIVNQNIKKIMMIQKSMKTNKMRKVMKIFMNTCKGNTYNSNKINYHRAQIKRMMYKIRFKQKNMKITKILKIYTVYKMQIINLLQTLVDNKEIFLNQRVLLQLIADKFIKKQFTNGNKYIDSCVNWIKMGSDKFIYKIF